MIEVRTGGKLYIAGEYAILAPGQTALIKAVPLYMRAQIAWQESYDLYSDMFTYSVDLTPDANYALIQETVAVMEAYLQTLEKSLRPFRLSISGKMERDGLKFGIGSSGSVVVLTMKAMATLYDLDLSKDLLFKLSAYVLLKRGDNGSMGDIACIAYDDLIAYQAFDRAKLRDWITQKPMIEVLTADWGYLIEPVQSQLPIEFLVGWTRQPAISKDMINAVRAAIDQPFLTGTQQQVRTLIAALRTGDKVAIKASVEQVSSLLAGLSSAIYTEKLQELKTASQGLDCVAKSSGAGGGDCGIALSFSENDSQILIKRWQEAGIELLARTPL